jgi:hypothetical protein
VFLLCFLLLTGVFANSPEIDSGLAARSFSAEGSEGAGDEVSLDFEEKASVSEP